MRLLGMMVTRNEADRFLVQALQSLRHVCSGIAVFDDASDDDTVGVALRQGAFVDVRDLDEPSFVQHEGQFRTLAWRFMETTLQPEPGDWILSLDADEVLVADDGNIHNIYGALNGVPPIIEALRLPIHELWELDPPRIRTDGFWAKIAGTRLFRWRALGCEIPDRPLASGSVPGVPRQTVADLPGYGIAHLGYVRAADRHVKYDRYRNRAGHASAHVESILKKPTLAPMPVPLL